jgi:Na+-transporting methylmalonyl-CoA/oxaloacetate decarboxylase gamma subunit
LSQGELLRKELALIGWAVVGVIILFAFLFLLAWLVAKGFS